MSVACDRSVVFSGVSSTNKTDRHDITEIIVESGVKHNKDQHMICQGHMKVVMISNTLFMKQYICLPNFISKRWQYGHENYHKIHLFDLDIQGIWRSWWSKYHKSISKDKRVTAWTRLFEYKKNWKKSPIKTICLPSFIRWRGEIIFSCWIFKSEQTSFHNI